MMDDNQYNDIPKARNNNCECYTDIGRGCTFCDCGEGESTETKVCDGCFKLHVTDWLKDYPDNLSNDIFEVRFKNTRRSYYQNVNNIPLEVGDIVAVEASPGHDIGIISLTGDMVARQMRRVGFNPMNGEFKKIYRKAKPNDIEKWEEAIALEHETMIRARQIAADMNLNMKIGDVEYQGDKIKAIFYYIADERVDFRELIKVFAEIFRIRVEMKQIGARQEAGRIGGLGSCGRELCCASWISSFMSVTTNAARTQEISLNPQKLAGQCSKLKCCLVYEYDNYMDARKDFPRVTEPLRALDGDYYFVKNDILARTMSFSASPDSMASLITLSIDRVREIILMNAKGIKPEKLDSEKTYAPKKVEPGFVNAIGEDSITRFDTAKKKPGKKRKGGSDNRNGDSVKNTAPAGNSASESGKSDKGNARNQEGGNLQRRRNQERTVGADGNRQDNKNKTERRNAGRNSRGTQNLGQHKENRGGIEQNNERRNPDPAKQQHSAQKGNRGRRPGNEPNKSERRTPDNKTAKDQ